MDEVSEAHEQAEQAEEARHGGRKHVALMIAVVAAGLAFCEQGAQHADTRMNESAIDATDIWAEYQAKSIRANQTRDLADMTATLQAQEPAARDALVARLRADAERFEHDPKSGKAALAAAAHAREAVRDAARERLEMFDNAAAALQLAIVMLTASVITGSAMLVWVGLAIAAVGAGFGIYGVGFL
jgi:hypothetical protein